MKSSLVPLHLIAACLACGCTSSLDEGNEKLDPNDSGDWSDTSTEDTQADTGEPIPAELEVCYPGADLNYEACLPLVDWTAAWGSDYDYPEPYQGNPQYAAPVRFIDLETADPEMVLAPNFRLEELMQAWKGRFGLYQVHAVESLQALRDLTGGPLNIYSGFRSVAYNASVDGVTHSRHMYGDAADMGSSVVSLTQLGANCDDLNASYVGYYETHVHCDWRNDTLDSSFYESIGAVSDHLSPIHNASLIQASDGVWTSPATGFDEGEPLRRWRAFDRHGQRIEEVFSRDYVVPGHAKTVEVWIGGQLTLEMNP